MGYTKSLCLNLVIVLSVISLWGCVCASDATSRENPVPKGSSFTVDDWQMKVVNVIPDATRMILAENMFNTKPKSGNQYFMVTIEAKNVGSREKSFNKGNLHLVGTSSIAYDPPWMLVVPNVIPSNDAFPGGTLKGNVAWEVASSDVGSLVMYYQPIFSSAKTFFALE